MHQLQFQTHLEQNRIWLKFSASLCCNNSSVVAQNTIFGISFLRCCATNRGIRFEKKIFRQSWECYFFPNVTKNIIKRYLCFKLVIGFCFFCTVPRYMHIKSQRWMYKGAKKYSYGGGNFQRFLLSQNLFTPWNIGHYAVKQKGALFAIKKVGSDSAVCCANNNISIWF